VGGGISGPDWGYGGFGEGVDSPTENGLPSREVDGVFERSGLGLETSLFTGIFREILKDF